MAQHGQGCGPHEGSPLVALVWLCSPELRAVEMCLLKASDPHPWPEPREADRPQQSAVGLRLGCV